jgi:diguanylate cyclase (GGDEF)-like protein/PAS domain S-box-containing protein
MNIGRRLRNYLGAFSAITLLAGALFWFYYTQTFNTINSELKLESNQLINQLTNHLNLSIREIHSDIRLIAEQYAREYRHNHDNPVVNHTLAQLWISFAKQRKRYDQIRFINPQGQELIHINYNDGNPISVDPVPLQSKDHHDYFMDAIQADAGIITASQLDLNTEHNRIELPLKPTLRFSTQVVSAQGRLLGVVTLNYLAKNLLDDFMNVSAGYTGAAMLLNWKGYSLNGLDTSQNWSFMFPDSPQSTAEVIHQDAWRIIGHQPRGQFQNPKGIYTFENVNPSSHSHFDTTCKGCLRILLFTPRQVIQTQLWRRLSRILPLLGLSALILGILIALALWHREKRQINEHQIQNLNRKITHEHELFISGPGVIAKLHNELGWPIEFISDNAEDLLGYPPEHFRRKNCSYSSLIAPEYLDQFTRETLETDHRRLTSYKRKPYQVIDRFQQRKWVQDTTHVIRNSQGKLTHFFVHLTDISPLKEAEELLTRSHDYIQKVVDTLPDPTLVIDINTYQLQLLNRSALKLYSGGDQIKPGTTCFQLSHKRTNPCKGNLDPCPIQEIKRTHAPVSVIHKHLDTQGRVMFIDVRATPIFDDSGEQIVQIIESHRDITQTVEMERELQHIAQTDRLTQVYNRLKFDEELMNMIAWASLTHNRFGLIMLDLDHFKDINDTYGHDMGDQVLKNTVELLHNRIRKSDILARWGGEEFMIITPLISREELVILVESLRSAIEQYPHKGIGKVTASFGASVVTPSDNIESLIKRVDSALYESKQNGRNRCTVI